MKMHSRILILALCLCLALTVAPSLAENTVAAITDIQK